MEILFNKSTFDSQNIKCLTLNIFLGTKKTMNVSNLSLAEAYYKALNHKDIGEVAQYLHPDAHFLSPFFELKGKEAVLGVIKVFMQNFNSISIRAKCGSPSQVMIAYDVNFSEAFDTIRTAVLMTFKDNLIFGIELFFDPRTFEKNK